MRALGTLPGVARIDDGTGLFVRGGDVSETLVLLDGVVVSHPYRYETPTGGFRGAIDPFLTQGVSFTTGGFSAQYANTLSGVVDLVAAARPREMQTTVTAGLAGLSASAAWPIGETAGVRIAANRSTPAVLFAVNPSPARVRSAAGRVGRERQRASRVIARRTRPGVRARAGRPRRRGAGERLVRRLAALRYPPWTHREPVGAVDWILARPGRGRT